MQNFEKIKSDFPLFINQPDLVYFDSAATALKPESVLQAMDGYYRDYSSNVSRGLYPMAERATEKVDEARKKVASFIDCSPENIIFVASATHGINTVATGLKEKTNAKHNIVVTALEHHSNFLPWKELCRMTGAEFRIVPVENDGLLDPQKVASFIDENTLLCAFGAVSNVLGLINPTRDITREIRKKNPDTLILVDACQAVGHIEVSLKKWGVDFLVFSAHKLFGPTGIGVLAGKKESLDLLSPVNVGGGTVLDSLASPALYKNTPDRFEGGTPNIAGIIGLGAAINYAEQIGLENIRKHEVALTSLLVSSLHDAFGKKVTVLGSLDSEKRAGIVSFTLSDVHPHDIAHMLGENNICIRAGENCARPLHHSLNIPASARVSISVYNSRDDISRIIQELKKIMALLQ